MALNSVFNIAKSSLFAHQQALAVTSANLANVNNPAYSRQIAMFGTMAPHSRAPLWVHSLSLNFLLQLYSIVRYFHKILPSLHLSRIQNRSGRCEVGE